MLKRCTILGLVLAVAGAGALVWVWSQAREQARQIDSCRQKYAAEPDALLNQCSRWGQLTAEQQNQFARDLERYRQSETPQMLAEQQKGRLLADLEELAAGNVSVGPLAELLYGSSWQSEVDRYRKTKEERDIIQTGATVGASIGGVLFGSCGLLWMGKAVRSVIRKLTHRRRACGSRTDDASAGALDVRCAPGDQTGCPEREAAGRAVERVSAPRDKAPVTSACQQFESDFATRRMALQDRAEPLGIRSSHGSPGPYRGRDVLEIPSGAELLGSGRTAVEETADPGGLEDLSMEPRGPGAATAVLEMEDSATAERESLRVQAEDLQRQVTEFRQMAQTLAQTTAENSEPLKNTLNDLAQQVSAIREYAAQQQDRVERLQNGYDWNIVRTFCLRIIRCIDNLEARIERCSTDDGQSEPLTEVRDELLFALESSGVEQFRPQINSEYRGQERLAEAVKERKGCKDPNKAGKIAEVIRPGYRYIVSEDNVRVVRTAQVRLYA